MTIHITSAPADHPALSAVAQTLNYKGDRRSAVGHVMGPTYSNRERLTVMYAEYDDDADRTKLGLAYGVHEIPAATS